MTAVIGAECRGCGACLLTCPEHAVRPGGGLPGGPIGDVAGRRPAQTASLLVLADLCNDCGECAEICPADAIEVIDD